MRILENMDQNKEQPSLGRILLVFIKRACTPFFVMNIEFRPMLDALISPNQMFLILWSSCSLNLIEHAKSIILQFYFYHMHFEAVFSLIF